MKRRYILIIWSILLTLLPLLNGCIREEEFDNTPQGNFEALWKIIDEQYCFLDYKQIDWDAIHDKYQPLITPGMSYDGLFEILGNMLAELKKTDMSTCTLPPTWRATGTGIWIILVTSTKVSLKSTWEETTALLEAPNIPYWRTT